MPLFKNIIQKKKADHLAVDYHPQPIESQISEEALQYIEKKDEVDFRLDKIVSEYTGIDELEKLSRQREIEKEALELSREIQEKAYEEAYQLGLQEGKKKAFDEEKARIDKEVNYLQTLIQQIEVLKNDLLKENENHIVKLCFYLAKRLFMREVKENNEYLLPIIKKAVEMSQAEDNVVIKLCSEDFKFIEDNKDQIFKDFNIRGTAKIEEDEGVARGGVIIETNYGVIDATIDQRLEKLNSLLEGQMSL